MPRYYHTRAAQMSVAGVAEGRRGQPESRQEEQYDTKMMRSASVTAGEAGRWRRYAHCYAAREE